MTVCDNDSGVNLQKKFWLAMRFFGYSRKSIMSASEMASEEFIAFSKMAIEAYYHKIYHSKDEFHSITEILNIKLHRLLCYIYRFTV